jgi:hypothetical protein
MNRCLIGLIFSCVFTAPVVVEAQEDTHRQQGPTSATVSATLVARETGAAPLVMRRLQEPRDLILVDLRTVTPQELGQAIRLLAVLNAGDPEGRERSDRAASSTDPNPFVSALPGAAAELARLRRAPPTDIPGFGTFPSFRMQLEIPPGWIERN